MPEMAIEIRRTGWFDSVTIFVPTVCSHPWIQRTGLPRGGGGGEGITVGIGDGEVGAGKGEGFDASEVEWCEQAPTTNARHSAGGTNRSRMARPSLRGRARHWGCPDDDPSRTRRQGCRSSMVSTWSSLRRMRSKGGLM